MRRPSSRSVPLAALALGLLILGPPDAAEAQLRVGGHAVHAGKAFGGGSGFGIRAGFGLPFVPVDLAASGEYFFPDCAPIEEGCGLRGYGVDGNFRMVFPFVRPYVSGGLIYRRMAPGGGMEPETRSGLAVGAGIDVSLGGMTAFGEGRYEFVDPVRQPVWRLGLLFPLN